MKKKQKTCIKWLCELIKKRTLIFLTGFIFAILCFVAINAAMEPLSKPEFCGTVCHEMKPSYDSWKRSSHNINKNGLRIDCIDCHLPSKNNYFNHIIAKVCTGTRDLYIHHFGDEYDIKKVREKVLANFKNKKCLSCHVNLLAYPASDLARQAHTQILKPSEPAVQLKCLDCHKDTGHLR